MQARWGTHGDHPIIVLSASTVQECLEMTVTAFNLAEKYRNPVILLLDEVTAHTREKIIVPNPGELEILTRIRPSAPPDWFKPFAKDSRGVPPMSDLGAGYRIHVTGLTHDPMGFPTQRPDEIEESITRLFRKIDQFMDDIILVDEHCTQDADIGVVAYGSVARSAWLAIDLARQQGVNVGLLTLKTLSPFPRKAVQTLCNRCKCVIVPEMNMGQISREVKRVNAGRTRIRTLNRIDGQIITPSQIHKSIIQV